MPVFILFIGIAFLVIIGIISLIRVLLEEFCWFSFSTKTSNKDRKKNSKKQ